MPYSIPGALPTPSQGHPGHRRSHSNISFVTGGAYTPMAPPRRKTVSTPRFHLKSDDDDSSHSDDDTPVMKPAPTPVHSGGAVPFPRSSPLSSPVPQQAKVPFPITTTSSSPRPSFSRTCSTPILLSNGKPLKSSLKSSSSSPNIPFPSQSLVPSMMHHHHHHHQHAHHLRAASAPTTPHLLPSPPSSPTQSSSSSPVPGSPQTPSSAHPKNVHFPSQEEGGLATVRLFKRSARPAALSKPEGEETETETEGESSAVNGGGWRSYSKGYPFPRSSSSPSPLATSGLGAAKFEIDTNTSSPVPSPSVGTGSGTGNIHLESLLFKTETMNLSGTLLVRNLAYEKVVAVRFTLDEWDTTSEVLAKYGVSLPSSSSHVAFSSVPLTLGDVVATTNADKEGWDRFGFSIRLEDYAHNLSERTMWLVVRYVTEGGGEGKEWWDNNGGENYRVSFRVSKEKGGEKEGRKRQVALSAPPAFPLPPKLSSSSSLPPSWTSPSYPSPLSPTTSPMSQAKAQTTLTRLKKLNLRNYAAPGSVGATAAAAVISLSPRPNLTAPPTTIKEKEDTTSTSDSLTTTPLTSPLHTPVGEHNALPLPLVREQKDKEEEEGCGLPVSLSRRGCVNGRGREAEEGLGISPREGMGMDIIAGFPATIISGGATACEMGVSPPFSSFGFGNGGGGGAAAGGMHWGWGSSSVPVSKSTSPPTSTTPKSSPPLTTPSGPKAKTTLPALLLDDIRKKSTHSPPRSPVPSLRREKGPPGFLLEGGSASSSGSASGSDADVPVSKDEEDVESIKVPVPIPAFSYTPPTPRKSHSTHSNSNSNSPSPSPSPSPTTPRSQTQQTPSPSSSSDEIYQAFVRQWCFAQGPVHPVGGVGEKMEKGGVVG